MMRGLFLALLLGMAATAALAEGVQLPAHTRVDLDNGITLVLSEKHDVPLIGLQAVVRGGAVADPAGKHGLAALLAALMEKGAGERNAAQFAEAVDSVGGRLSASGGLEGINVSAEFLARDADLMVELLADMLVRPALDKDEFEKLRERQVNSIRAAKDGRLGALMPVYGSAFLFGDHPYGNPVSGSESTLEAIAIGDVRSWYEEHVGADRLIVAIAGDFEASAMEEKFRAAFGGWRAANGELPEIPVSVPEAGRRVLLIDKPGAAQTYFLLANIGVGIDYPNRADLDLANTLFGGRFTSMLNTALRVESGLTYGARSRLVRPSSPGAVAISSFTATATTVEAIDMALDVLGELLGGTIGEEMIQSGRNYILGQYPTDFETASQLAAQLAMLEAYGLDAGYINDYGSALAAVNAESLRAVIDEVYPAADNLVFIILGDAERIREDVATYGPVTELAIGEPRFRP